MFADSFSAHHGRACTFIDRSDVNEELVRKKAPYSVGVLASRPG